MRGDLLEVQNWIKGCSEILFREELPHLSWKPGFWESWGCARTQGSRLADSCSLLPVPVLGLLAATYLSRGAPYTAPAACLPWCPRHHSGCTCPQSSRRCRPGPVTHRGCHHSQTSPQRPLTFALLPRVQWSPHLAAFISQTASLASVPTTTSSGLHVSCFEHGDSLLPGLPTWVVCVGAEESLCTTSSMLPGPTLRVT